MEKMPNNGDTPFLPEEITTNILKRLQCVCKHWNTLIKTPSFIHHHLHHSTHQKNPSLLISPGYSDYGFHLLLFNTDMQFHDLKIAPFIDSLEGLTIEGSSNGLLCFVQWGKHYAHPLLCNPATREVKRIIPESCNDSSDTESETESYFVSDPKPHLDWYFGFGFSAIINDYKIVKIFEKGDIHEVGVYSVREGCWRNVPFDNIKGVSISGQSVTANGVIFWYGAEYRMRTRVRSVIVSFDLVTEVFIVIPYPTFTSHSEKLVVYDDKLAIIFHDKAENAKGYSIYLGVMEEGAIDSSEGRWSSSEMCICDSDFILYAWAWTIWNNQIVTAELERPDTPRCGMESPKQLHLVDVMTNEYQRFDIPKFEWGYRVSVFNYVESLVPIGGDFQIEEP